MKLLSVTMSNDPSRYLQSMTTQFCVKYIKEAIIPFSARQMFTNIILKSKLNKYDTMRYECLRKLICHSVISWHYNVGVCSYNRLLNNISCQYVLSNLCPQHSAKNESKIIVLDTWSPYMLDSIGVCYNEIYKHFLLLIHHQFIYGILFYSEFYFA